MMLSHSEEDKYKDDLQKEIATLPMKAGQLYRHYKGGSYEVVTLALKEDTLEFLVIYKSLDRGGTIWARTWSNWNEEVEVGGRSVPRFTRVS